MAGHSEDRCHTRFLFEVVDQLIALASTYLFVYALICCANIPSLKRPDITPAQVAALIIGTFGLSCRETGANE